MADSGGSLKPGTSSAYANGKLNGPAQRSAAKRRRGFFAWAFSLVAMLSVWAAILTVLFRCPSSLDACDDSSPSICKHYFWAKAAVSPHLQPYYDHYAAPYVDVARPYCDAVNSHVLTPTRVYAVRYGAPLARRAQDYAWSQWEAKGQPRLHRLHAASQARYDRSIAPHLGRTGDAVGPYYEIARTNSFQLFYEYILPSYRFACPYAIQGYGAASDFAANKALPATRWAWNKTTLFLDTTVWPQLRALYVENVEPQLVRIGERLGRYKNKATTKVLSRQSSPDAQSTTPEPTQPSFGRPRPRSSAPPPVAQENAFFDGDESADSDELDDEDAKTAEEDSKAYRKAREMVAHDLELWQTKFVKQADAGASDIQGRVDEIARRMMREKAEVAGKDHVRQLEATIESELADVKRNISSIVGEASEDAEDKAVGAIRSAGVAIKEKAQMIRGWRQAYDAELQQAVAAAADGHFKILDVTRSLALQEIGMRWAWTNDISYKDWAKYHELRDTLAEWTEDLKHMVVIHPTLLKAQDAAAQVEDEGMTIASAAARELARLKEVAHWKMLAGDATDSFDSDAMRLAAEAAEKAGQVEETVAEHLDGAESVVVQDAAEQGSTSAAKLSRPAEEAVGETASAETSAAEEASFVVDAAGVASEAARDRNRTSEAASSRAQPRDQTGREADEEQSTVESSEAEAKTIVLGAGEDVLPADASPEGTVSGQEGAAGTLAAEGSAAFMGSMPTPGENRIQDDSAAAEDDAQSGDMDDTDDTEEGTVDAEDKRRGTEAPRVNATFGAAAQSVSDRRPVLDDFVDSEAAASAAAAARAVYSSAVSAASNRYSSALSVVSAQIDGTPRPVDEQLFSSVSAAYDKAVSAASGKLDAAVDAASSGVYGKPTPTRPARHAGWEKAESVAARHLNEGRLWAEVQYQSALMALGLATPTPMSPADKLVEQAKFNYYAGLGLAQDRYTSFMSAASSAWSSMTATATATGFAGSASAASESASAARAAGDQTYAAGVLVADAWDRAVSELSARVYGEPTATGRYDKVIESAGSHAAAATEAARGRGRDCVGAGERQGAGVEG